MSIVLKRLLLTTIVCFFAIMSLFACVPISAGETTGVRDEENSHDETVVIDQIEMDFIDVGDYLDDLYGVVYLEEDKMVLTGIKNNTPHILLTDPDIGEIHRLASSWEETDGKPIGLCNNRGGGFTVYYQSLLDVYNTDGELSDTIDLGNQKERFDGPVHLGDDRYLFWQADTFIIRDKDRIEREGRFSRGAEIISVCHNAGNYYVYLAEGEELIIYSMDPETLLTEKYAVFTGPVLPDVMIYTGKTDSLYLSNGTSVYSYIPESSRFEKRFSYAQAGLEERSVKYMAFVDDKTIYCFSRGVDTLFRIKKTGSITRQLITVGSIKGVRDLEQYVAKFNAENEEYYAEIKYYDYYNQDAMLVDLGTGRAPDVMNLNMADFIPRSGSVFADLLPYLEADEKIRISDFYPLVFEQMLIDGSMLTAQSGFTWYSISARSRDVEGRETWSIRDALDLFERETDRYILVGWNSTQNMTGWACRINIPQFVDFETLTCDFETEEFYSLLDFCKATAGRNAPMNVPEYDEQILLHLEIFETPYALNHLKLGYEGDEYCFIGFPNDDGKNGAFFAEGTYDLSFAIPLQTKNKDLAWEFIRGVYDHEWQTDVVYGFPIIQSAMDERLEQLQKEMPIVTQEDVLKVKNAMEKTTYYVHEDESIVRIIQEEAMYYISGDKTAEEVASVIQSRVSLLLSERQ